MVADTTWSVIVEVWSVFVEVRSAFVEVLVGNALLCCHPPLYTPRRL